MSIKLKLTILFLAVATAPLILLSVVTFRSYRDSIKAVSFSGLENIASYKADIVGRYFDSIRCDIEITSDLDSVRFNFPILNKFAAQPLNPEFLAAKEALDGRLKSIQKALNLNDIMLVNPEGRIVYSSNPGHQTKNFLNNLPDPGKKAFTEGKARAYLTDIFINESENNRPMILLTAPVGHIKNALVGVIAFELDVAPLYEIIQDTKGLGSTGETLIGRKSGNEILFLNSLRHDPYAALKRRLRIGGKTGVPIQKAVQGQSGSGPSIDYRNKAVIAAWRPISSLGWGLVTKIDTDEAFAAITNLERLMLKILVIIIAVVVAMALLVVQSISEPIKRLAKGVEIVGSGNLDYEVGTDLKDEIGQLSRAFDKMTRDLKVITASRDELNREIAKRKWAEEILRQTRDYLENLFNHANAPIICWDEQFKITRFNQAFERLTDYKAEEVFGKDLKTLFPVESNKASFDKIRRTLTGEKWEVMEIPIRRKDGRVRIALWNSANIYAEDGRTLVATIAQGQDITERKKAEDDLKRSNENLEQFAYVASHDLQEPLRVMSSYSQLLERRYKDKLDQDAKDFINFIADAAKRMQRLITDILAYSRVGAKNIPEEDVDYGEAVRKVIYGMGSAIGLCQGKVTYDKLPVLKAHETSVMQLFQNLIGNALKFRGEAPVAIHISAKEDGNCWIFSVRDNGLGIEPQYHERIFQIFQRLHSRDVYTGTGIGLSICKKIITQYGGRIWVESELGKGSTFYFTIPTGGK